VGTAVAGGLVGMGVFEGRGVGATAGAVVGGAAGAVVGVGWTATSGVLAQEAKATPAAAIAEVNRNCRRLSF